jgi:hypothetical protein
MTASDSSGLWYRKVPPVPPATRLSGTAISVTVGGLVADAVTVDVAVAVGEFVATGIVTVKMSVGTDVGVSGVGVAVASDNGDPVVGVGGSVGGVDERLQAARVIIAARTTKRGRMLFSDKGPGTYSMVTMTILHGQVADRRRFDPKPFIIDNHLAYHAKMTTIGLLHSTICAAIMQIVDQPILAVTFRNTITNYQGVV